MASDDFDSRAARHSRRSVRNDGIAWTKRLAAPVLGPLLRRAAQREDDEEMAWRGRDVALKIPDAAAFAQYLRSLSYAHWRPSGMVLHNTASPTLQQWWFGGTSPEQRMVNLKNYYIGLGWSAGPHAFVDGKDIWVMTDFNVSGVHSPSWNGTRLGIEMVGDYNTESDEEGMGAKVMSLTVALFGECHKYFGWEPSNTSIKLHKEDPATDHDCPGKNVVKSEFISDVVNYMGDGGDHQPNPPQPTTPVQGTVANVAARDKLNVRATPSSSAPVIGQAENGDQVLIVGSEYNGSTQWYHVQFGDAAGAGVAVYGWCSAAYVQKAGGTVPAEQWHTDITATEFATAGDPQNSAYPPYDRISSSTLGVALPYKWSGSRPRVLVEGPRGTVDAAVVDVGPWNINNPEYVLQGRRPLSETQYQQHTPAQNGQVPTNDAGIDLTPAVANAVGTGGKGKVRWRFA